MSSKLPHVETTLNYLGDVEGTPTAYTYPPPPGVPKSYDKDKRTVAIYDARALDPAPSLEQQGFQLFDHEAGIIEDFYDECAVEAQYYPAAVDLVEAITGASEVVVFDHTYRSSRPLKEDEPDANAPVQEAHNDYTEDSGPRRAHNVAAGRFADALAENRYMIINLWRSINGTIEEKPLAVCDAQSMAPADFVPADVKFPSGRIGNVMVLRYNDAHRWYYYPAMKISEVLVFKTFDPNADGPVHYDAHSSFADPTSHPGGRLRASIELRVLAIFD